MRAIPSGRDVRQLNRIEPFDVPDGEISTGWRAGDNCESITLYYEAGGLGPELYLRVRFKDGAEAFAPARHYWCYASPAQVAALSKEPF